MSGAAKHGVHGIAQRSSEPFAPQLAVVLPLVDGRFNGASPLDNRLDATRDATSLA